VGQVWNTGGAFASPVKQSKMPGLTELELLAFNVQKMGLMSHSHVTPATAPFKGSCPDCPSKHPRQSWCPQLKPFWSY